MQYYYYTSFITLKQHGN